MSIRKNRMAVGWLAGGLVALLSAGVAYGQTVQFGKISGTVFDPQGEPLAGAAVILSSEALVAGQRATTTSADGNYVFLSLPAGEYHLTATSPEFKTYNLTGIVISAGSSITVDVAMEMGVVEEVITVVSEAVLDVKTSTIDTRFSDELLEKVPTARDAFYDLSLTAPGMSPHGAEGGWLPSPSAYGGGTNENIFLLNGVNITNPRGASWGPLVDVNYETVEEVRLISLGSKAEYGSFSGVAMDVLTKSGGNDYRGKLTYYEHLDTDNNQPSGTSGFGEDWLFAAGGDVVSTLLEDSYEANATLGGPIVKDRLWFYAGYARIDSETDTPIFEPLALWDSDLFDLKLTAEPASNHYAWLAYHYNDSTAGNVTWLELWDPTMVYDTNSKNDTLSFQWQYFPTDRTFLSAKYLGFETNDEPTIPSEPSTPGFINWWKWGQYGVAGAFPYVEAQKSERNTLQADVSHYAEDFLGQHDLKFGVQYTEGEGNWQGGYFHGYANFAYPEPWTQVVQYLKDWYGDTGLRFYVNQPHFNPFLTVRESDSTGFFADDQWLVNDRLTLNLGLRFDNMTAKYGEGAVYEQPNSIAGMNGPPPVIRTREGTDDIYDFDTWSPRIGLSYLLDQQGKTVLRANVGRYYAPISLENLRRFGPDMPLTHTYVLHYSVPFDIADADGDGFIGYDDMVTAVRELPNLAPTRIDDMGFTDPSWQLQVDPGTEDTYSDQFTLSVARQLGANLAVEATYIFKDTENLLVNWPINGATGEDWQWERVPHTTLAGEEVELYSIVLLDYNGDGIADIEDARWVLDNNDFSVRNLGTVDGITADREYQGLQLVFNKRYANRWQMTGSLLYSDSEGFAPRTVTQRWYIDGPMITDDTIVSSPNMLINNMEGQLPMTPEWSLKLAGSYRIPKVEMDLGYRYRWAEGTPIWMVEAVPVFAPWSGSLEGNILTGSTGLSGNIISVDPNDPDYLPDQSILDLSLAKDFGFARDMSFGVTLDVLNVFNEDAANRAGFHDYDYGRVYSLVTPRIWRLGLRFEF